MHLVSKKILSFLINNQIPKARSGRHDSQSLYHYLDVIGNVLKTGVPWRSIKNTLHYSTYHKKFTLYNKYGIFQLAHQILIKYLRRQKKIATKELFIDSTMIKNIQGRDGIGINHYDRGRKGVKISVIVTNQGIPLGMKVSKSNIHDLNLVNETIDDIKIKIVGSRLVGDKGYVSSKMKNELLLKRGIRMIYPLKKGEKKVISQQDKKLLKDRHIVENFFSWMKQYRRIRNRYDHQVANYIGFCYLDLIEMIVKKLC